MKKIYGLMMRIMTGIKMSRELNMLDKIAYWCYILIMEITR